MEFDSSFEPLFNLGEIKITKEAQNSLEEASIDPRMLIKRHGRGDWGESASEINDLNEKNLSAGGSVSSRYPLPTGKIILALTDMERTETCLFLEDGWKNRKGVKVLYDSDTTPGHPTYNALIDGASPRESLLERIQKRGVLNILDDGVTAISAFIIKTIKGMTHGK